MRTIRQSVRSLIRQPGFSALVVLTSALGIGTATAVYSLVYAILLRPFPYTNPGDLVRVQTRHLSRGDALGGCSLLDINDYRRRATTIGRSSASPSPPSPNPDGPTASDTRKARIAAPDNTPRRSAGATSVRAGAGVTGDLPRS